MQRLISVSMMFVVGLAAPVPACATAGVDSPPPYCVGRELGLTRWSAAYEFAWNYCTCIDIPPEGIPSCAEDKGHQLLVGDPDTIICGDLLADGEIKLAIDVYNECLVETATCGGIPLKCWNLCGWDL